VACAVPSLALVATSLVAQLMPKPPKRRRDPNSLDTPMAQENFLYLLSELEQAVEPLRVCWRLHSLRRWSHDEEDIKSIFS
jgi:hypothetical protein